MNLLREVLVCLDDMAATGCICGDEIVEELIAERFDECRRDETAEMCFCLIKRLGARNDGACLREKRAEVMLG